MDIAALTDGRAPVYTPGVKRPANLKALTSVRFFAALHVAFYHMVRPFARWGLFAGVAGCGYVGVSFFFLLSGFILTYSHAQEFEAGLGRPVKFWVARFAWIYPVYLLCMIVSGALSHADLANRHVIAFGADLVLLQAWFIRLVNFFNIPSWTISCEAFFYLVFPYVLMRLRPSSSRRALLTMAAFWLLALAVPAYCVLHYPQDSLTEQGKPGPGGTLTFEVRRWPILMLPEFLAGISLGWFYLRFKPSPRMLSILAWCGLGASAIVLALADRLPFMLLHNGLLLPVFALVLLGLCGSNLLTRLLSHPMLVLLGEASFSLYLFHFIYNDATAWWYGPQTIRAAMWKLAVLIPASVLLHLYLERPCRRLILDWWRRRHPQELAAVRG